MTAFRPKMSLVQTLVTGMCLLAILIAVVGFYGNVDTLTAAREAARQGDMATASKLAEAALRTSHGNLECIRIGAEAAQQQGDIPRAIWFLEQLRPNFRATNAFSAWQDRATLQQDLGRVSAAVETLRTIVEHIPGDALSHRRLAVLLSDCGYEVEALVHAKTLVESGGAGTSELVMLAKNGRGVGSADLLRHYHDANQTDEMPINGLLRLARRQRKPDECQSLLKLLRETNSPESVTFSCQRLAVEYSVDAGPRQNARTSDAIRTLLSHNESHPEVWLLAAKIAEHDNDRKEHLRCLIKAVRQSRWSRPAIHALSAELRTARPNLAQQFSNLAQRLEAIEKLASQLAIRPGESELLHQISINLAAIGRTAEAKGWARIAIRQDASLAWATTLIVESVSQSWKHPIEHFPAGSEPAYAKPTESPGQNEPKAPFEFQFLNDAESVGLNFQYENGRREMQEGLQMHQWTGGGVAVLDIDHDSWPDLYCTQGGNFPQLPDDEIRSDSLFRNRRGQSFLPVADRANVHESEFGQGVAAGDVNNDGFDDIYVANVGPNRLLINQGDGTFLPIDNHHSAGVWTTSVAIADLNADTLPDLYDVNYVGGELAFTQTCDHDGFQRICGPTDFSAEPDCLSFSDGIGRFQAATADTFPTGPEGRGMGVVIGPIGKKTGNQIYVANDESGNQLFVQEGSEYFEDVATKMGVAFDHYGQRQGSMGIAAGDADQSGTLDLFVTNYYGEANALYSQVAKSAFLETTVAAGLMTPGYSQLGFGCQFLDADNDGDLDLVVANGHLDDFTHLGQPYRMKPQLFCNGGRGHYDSVLSAGPFFNIPDLGRAVATLDWNRDGRGDFVVGHLDSPVALLTNNTVARSQPATVVLIGTNSPRRPIGAAVDIEGKGRKQHRWLTAGDGYQCSNEPHLRFVLHQHRPAGVHVTWPSGQQQPFAKVAAELTALIEGRRFGYAIPQ